MPVLGEVHIFESVILRAERPRPERRLLPRTRREAQAKDSRILRGLS
jgi:hypothetical protein